ncbi:hypothetical protein A0H81_12273 [Grifola frondosa]|uniref:Uncharacterized protein n=1 Tax=Grifola frondosa TaxID=5627 RepID=A0A1C7LYF7_GRIFR|nr:hypothetical protein A0H81_12273 [Grifola frondosa]
MSDIGPLLPISEIRTSTVATSLDGEGDTAASEVSFAQNRQPVSGKGRFANAVRSVIQLRAASAAFPGPERNARRQRTMSSDGQGGNGDPAEPISVLKSSRVAALVPKLRSLTTHDLAAHQALVRHLQFSPNGKFLATSSWDRTSVIFKVGDPFISHRTLAHPQGFVGQVAWSPSGHISSQSSIVVSRYGRRTACARKQLIADGPSSQSKDDLTGTCLGTYHFERMVLHDVAVTQDSRRMVCVGTLTASSDGFHPSKSRAEKQIIVYNMDKQEIENRVPVLHELRKQGTTTIMEANRSLCAGKG